MHVDCAVAREWREEKYFFGEREGNDKSISFISFDSQCPVNEECEKRRILTTK